MKWLFLVRLPLSYGESRERTRFEGCVPGAYNLIWSYREWFTSGNAIIGNSFWRGIEEETIEDRTLDLGRSSRGEDIEVSRVAEGMRRGNLGQGTQRGTELLYGRIQMQNHRVLRVNRREIQAAKEDTQVDVILNFRSKMKSHGRLSQSTDVTGENRILISVNTGSEWAAAGRPWGSYRIQGWTKWGMHVESYKLERKQTKKTKAPEMGQRKNQRGSLWVF